MVFALNAIGLAVWFPRIPDVKEALGLDVLTLAFCLFAHAGGHHARLSRRRRGSSAGSAPGPPASGAGRASSSASSARRSPGTRLTLGLALFLCGLTIATIEVAMNAKASQTERVLGRRIMTRCHAFWSFGTVAGALIGGAFARAG